MIKSYKLQTISVFQIFSLMFVSRIIVTLTYIPTLNFDKTNGDLLFSILLSLPVIIIGFIPTIWFLKKNNNDSLLTVVTEKNKLLGKGVGLFYFIWFVFNTAFNVYRFVLFVSAEMSQYMGSFFLIVLVIGAACYGAYLGIQSLGRVAAVYVWVLIFFFALIIILSIRNFDITNIAPFIENKLSYNILRALNIGSLTTEISVLLFITPKMTEKIGNTFIKWSVLVVVLVFSFFLMTVGCFGDFVQTQAYPNFSLSQIATFGIFQRLDAIHTSVWILGLFLKTAMFIYCANTCLRSVIKIKSGVATLVISSVASIGVALAISSSFISYWDVSEKWVNIITFGVVVVLIPLLCCFIKRKTLKGEVDEGN